MKLIAVRNKIKEALSSDVVFFLFGLGIVIFLIIMIGILILSIIKIWVIYWNW